MWILSRGTGGLLVGVQERETTDPVMPDKSGTLASISNTGRSPAGLTGTYAVVIRSMNRYSGLQGTPEMESPSVLLVDEHILVQLFVRTIVRMPQATIITGSPTDESKRANESTAAADRC